MVIEQVTAYDEVYDFLLRSPTPEQVIAFRPSEATQTRVRTLLDANKAQGLSEMETAELDEFLKLEHFMRMLKIRARQRLAE